MDVLQTSVNTAKSIEGEVKTGKGIATATKGAAAGPYGAAVEFLWANRGTVVKIMAAAAFILLLPILFALMLPSIIFAHVLKILS